MYTLLKPFEVREMLLHKGVASFTPQDFEIIFKTSPTRTKHFLETQTNDGLFTRLRKGRYVLRTDPPCSEVIANTLYRPSYISFEYALAFWGILPEMPYAITSATTKPTRDFITDGLAFSYFTIKRQAFTGYQLVDKHPLKGSEIRTTVAASQFLIAEPEKALVDYVYFIALGKKMLNDRLFIEKGSLDKAKVRAYATLYDRKKLLRLLEAYL